MVARVNDMAPAGAQDGPGALLREVARLHVRAQREQVACCGTTVAQCHILTELDRAGPLPLTVLGGRLGLDKGWVSRAVAGLVEDGLLDRAARPDDGRIVVLSLSAAGRRRVAALNRTLDAQAERVLRRIPAAERRQVQRALALVRGALREELGAPGRGPAPGRRSTGGART